MDCGVIANHIFIIRSLKTFSNRNNTPIIDRHDMESSPPPQEDGGGEFYPALVDLTFSPKPGGLGKWEV